MATPNNIRRNVHNYRNRLRAIGLRPKTIWVPDTRSSSFAEQLRQDSLAVRDLPSEAEALDWIEDIMTEDEHDSDNDA
ncbi:antitoxin MazE family protein (plasmid) [Skermanella mucosa]|uniref:antitoxin MazE family protein n=1 Tax=Skermanella mucosa TaxID=1789672 RepID=UPI001E3AF59F|nr:antitoxin MazE family protein [Skermanella mucosa]UEM24486.1 antitoxin MazE family protein [Skermanella mucosa]